MCQRREASVQEGRFSEDQRPFLFVLPVHFHKLHLNLRPACSADTQNCLRNLPTQLIGAARPLVLTKYNEGLGMLTLL